MRKAFVAPRLTEEASLATLTLFGAVSGCVPSPANNFCGTVPP